MKNRVQQILEWRTRRGRTPADYRVLFELEDLRRSWDKSRETQSDTLQDFFPVRLVTLVEVFVREWLRKIVDAGDPYLQRAESLTRNVKLDFAFLAALQGRHITVGDLVAHAISLSDLPQLLRAFDTLLNDQFTKQISIVHDRYGVEVEGGEPAPIVKDVAATFQAVSRLFQVRHILVHELPSHKPYTSGELNEFFDAVTELLTAADEILAFKLQGPIPLTQVGMNIAAGDKLVAVEESLRRTLDEVRSNADVDPKLLDASQAAWEKFVQSECSLHANLVAGGSMEPMVYAGRKNDLTKERIAQLNWWLEREEGDV
jgi:uncharacterized protein YecT (DUF1311 family)